MVTETWFRNPSNYIRECAEILAGNIVWDRGILRKKFTDPTVHAELYFPASLEYRLLLMGDQGTAELRRGFTQERPFAVYPTWQYGTDSMIELEEMLAHPVGEDEDACRHGGVPLEDRPVFGQEHRVVIIRPPGGNSGPGRVFFRLLAELQEEYPESIIHVHGLYGYRIMFGLGFKSVDVDPRFLAQKGKVTIPPGKEMTWEQTQKCPQWVTVLGFKPVDLAVPRTRCIYNMKSAQWAGKHYQENIKFQVRGVKSVDPNAINPDPPTTQGHMTKQLPVMVTDKFLCDTCSLQNTCKYFRTGSVCAIPETEPAKLSKLFKSRDAETIIEALATLQAAQANRLDRAIEDEQLYGELSTEVTKIINSLFANGVKLAKLRDPALAAAGAPKLNLQQININGGGPALVGRVVAELEARGISRDDITPDMIKNVIEGPAAIEASATETKAG